MSEPQQPRQEFDLRYPFRTQPDGGPCWCMSKDEPHEGWVHSPLCAEMFRRWWAEWFIPADSDAPTPREAAPDHDHEHFGTAPRFDLPPVWSCMGCGQPTNHFAAGSLTHPEDGLCVTCVGAIRLQAAASTAAAGEGATGDVEEVPSLADIRARIHEMVGDDYPLLGLLVDLEAAIHSTAHREGWQHAMRYNAAVNSGRATSETPRISPDDYSLAIAEMERQDITIDRLTRALRVATHRPHDDNGTPDPDSGFPVCSVCGAIQTATSETPRETPLAGLDVDVLAEAMVAAYLHDTEEPDDLGSVPSEPRRIAAAIAREYARLLAARGSE